MYSGEVIHMLLLDVLDGLLNLLSHAHKCINVCMDTCMHAGGRAAAKHGADLPRRATCDCSASTWQAWVSCTLQKEEQSGEIETLHRLYKSAATDYGVCNRKMQCLPEDSCEHQDRLVCWQLRMAEQGLSWLVLAHPSQVATCNLWSGSYPIS